MIKFLLERIAPVHIDTESIRYLYIKILNFYFYTLIHALSKSLMSTCFLYQDTHLYRGMYIHNGFIVICIYLYVYISIHIIYMCVYMVICVYLIFIYFNFKYCFNLCEKLPIQAQFLSVTRVPGIPIFCQFAQIR